MCDYSEADYQEALEPPDPGLSLETKIEQLEKIIDRLIRRITKLENANKLIR